MSDIEHHKLGPSSSAKWLACPGSPNAERGYPNTSNAAADEGSAAHQLGEWTLLSEDKNCLNFIGELAYTGFDGTEYYVDEEMASYVQEYVDYCLSIKEKYNGEMFVETKVNLGRIVSSVPFFVNENGHPVYILEDTFYDPSCIFISAESSEEVIEVEGVEKLVQYTEEGFGTSDTIIVSESRLDVIDLKYGKGIAVDAFENSQGLCYAVGSYDEHSWVNDFKDVCIHIHQPRLDSISEYKISADDLNVWAEEAHEAYLKTLPEDAPRIAGKKQCQWCAAKADCKAHLSLAFQDIVSDFDDFDDPTEAITQGQLVDPKSMSITDMAAIHVRASDISGILDSIKTKLTDEAKNGKPVPDFKLVKGRGSREYEDEEKASKAFVRKLGADVATPRKILTPPQMEKLKDKNGVKIKGSRLFSTHVRKFEGNLILAHKDDKRAEVTINVASDYEDFE